MLELDILIHEIGPEEIADVPLITMDELRYIRKLWLDEKREFDDSLPRIYEEVTGKPFEDTTIKTNKYYGKAEWDLLHDVCKELYPDEQLLPEMQARLLDVEAKSSTMIRRRNVKKSIEDEIKYCYYKDEEDAVEMARLRLRRIGQDDSVEEAEFEEEAP